MCSIVARVQETIAAVLLTSLRHVSEASLTSCQTGTSKSPTQPSCAASHGEVEGNLAHNGSVGSRDGHAAGRCFTSARRIVQCLVKTWTRPPRGAYLPRTLTILSILVLAALDVPGAAAAPAPLASRAAGLLASLGGTTAMVAVVPGQ